MNGQGFEAASAGDRQPLQPFTNSLSTAKSEPLRMGFSHEELIALTGGRPGVHDVPCPACGPHRRTTANRRRKVLRVWMETSGFASYHCARCGLSGHGRDPRAHSPSPRQMGEAVEEEAQHVSQRLRIARYLWERSQPATGTPTETYLRIRGIEIDPPATIRYLPASPPRHRYPAMITPFGFPAERDPGRLVMLTEAIRGVHLTLLRADGRGKAGTGRDKLMIGRSLGAPIVLAPANEGLALAIAEGIEDALSFHVATGQGAWAAGAASRLPALAEVVPGYVETITIAVDDDTAGRRGAYALGKRLARRGVEITFWRG